MKRLFLLVLSVISFSVAAQVTYNMSNTTVFDCTGKFLDSDAGMPAGDYDHNENLTFTICVPQATQIVMNFNVFCSEFFIDTISFFDGPDATAPLIFGPHSGSTNPPQIVATSGYLTITFVSDANLACGGWDADWFTVVPPPIPPIITLSQATCTSNIITVTTDSLIHCDSIYPAAFSLSGPGPYSILATNPLNCVNDSTNTFELILDAPLDVCGSYNYTFDLSIADACDSIYDFVLAGNFDIYDCPIISDIIIPYDSLCVGDCIDVLGFGDGGDCNLMYQWSNGWPATVGPHNLCPTGDTTIQLVVFDLYGNTPDTSTITVYAFPVPDAGPDTSWCLNASPFIPGNPDLPGGYWYGTGITDSLTGTFDPLVSGVGFHWVYYNRVDCIDSLLVTIFTVNAGPDQAACPSQPPFQLQGNSPPGGYYLGLFTDSTGLFSPDSVGSFAIAYHLNGCTDTLLVNVDTIAFSGPDTVCESETMVQFIATPFGGTFSGQGITDPTNGVFDASIAGPGDHVIYYDIVGCSDSLDVHVVGIDAGPDRTACPFGPAFVFSPASPLGGIYVGNGITDPNTGAYDPSWTTVNTRDTVTYSVNGCIDTVIVFLRNTAVGIDSLELCVNDAPLLLNFANTQRSPGGGNWAGSTGITDPNGPGTFDPAIGGVGYHTLVYSVNGCSDSLVIEVSPNPTISPQAAVCEYDPPFNLSADQPFGNWSGLGITDMNLGTFDPSIAGPGSHKVYYGLSQNCLDSIQVQVDAVPVINLSNVAANYCYNSVNQTIFVLPFGGSLTGPGASGSNQFNSAQAGQGAHTLQYVAQNGTCYDTALFQVNVLPALQVSTSFLTDTICFGDSLDISALANLGNGGPYTYSWDQGVGAGSTNTVKPTSTTIYTVTATDGCSSPATASLEVYVHPEIITNIVGTDTVCYDAQGIVSITGSPNYQYEWSTVPPTFGNTLTAFPGDYTVTITDNNTGCIEIDSTTIPGYPYLNAAFSKLPNRECILLSDGPMGVLDFSTGSAGGYWDFGEGNTIPYVPGVEPSYAYSDTGTYNIRLYLYNEGGCVSVFSEQICLKAEPLVKIPTAFSPNRDGLNDDFTFYMVGVKNVEMQVFDRWGERVGFDNEEPILWDGTNLNNGKALPQGVYAYIITYTDFLETEVVKIRGAIHLIR